MEVIRSPHNARLKAVRALRTGRNREHVLLEGARVVDEALKAGASFDFLLHEEEPRPGSRDLLARAEAAGIPCVPCEAKLLAVGSDLDAPTDLIGVAERPGQSADALLAACAAEGGVLLVVAGVQDPGNAGALVRVAAGLGAWGVLFVAGGASPWHPRALRGAAGTHFRLPLAADVSVEALRAGAAEHGVALWATAADGADPRDRERPHAVALLLGEEGRGLAPDLRDACAAAVGIPLTRGVESLNVATAAAVLLDRLGPAGPEGGASA